MVETYIENFGADKVTVVPFEKMVLETADRVNFIEGIFMALGLDMKVDISNLPIKNPSLPERAMEIQRPTNQLLSREEAQALAAHFVDNMPKLSSEGYRLFPEGARERLLDRYRELNQRLFTTRLSAYDPTYYVNS